MELINKVKVAIKQHKKYKKDVTKDLKKVVINKNIPLDDRWSLFIDSDLGFHETYIQRFNTIDLDPFYDRLEHRGITIDWDWVFDWYYDYRIDEIEQVHSTYSNKKIQDIIDKELEPIKEEILNKFIKSFDFAW